MKERRRRSLRWIPWSLVVASFVLESSPTPFRVPHPWARPRWAGAAEGARDAPAEPEVSGGSPFDTVPAEYRGNATPLESAETGSALRRAEEHFVAGEWARGLGATDEVIQAIAAGARRRQVVLPVKQGKDEKKEEAPAEGRIIVPFGGGEVPSVEFDGEDDPELAADEEVHSRDGVLYRPLVASIRERLLELPPEAQAAAVRTYEAPAREAYEKARGLPPDDAFRALFRAAERYPLAPSGQAAWAALGERLLTAGRFGDAARAFDTAAEILPRSDAISRATAIARSAVAWLLAGACGEARGVLEEAARRSPDAVVAIRGEPVAVRDLLRHPYFTEAFRRAEAARASGRASPSSEAFSWAAEAGAFDRLAFPFDRGSLPELGSQASWVFPLIEGSGDADRGNRPQLPHVRGATLGDRVFVRRRSDIVCVSARTGKRLWIASPTDSDPTVVTTPWGGAGLDAVLGLAVYAPPPGRDGSADGDSGAVGSRPLLVGVDRFPGVFQTRSGKLLFEPNRLVAYDVTSGKLLWQARAKARGFPKGIALVSAPAICGERVVLHAIQGESHYAVAFDLSGKLVWARRLYTASYAALFQYGRLPSLSGYLAAGETTVVSAAGLGLVCAVDAAAGEVLWVSRYRSEIRRGYYAPSRSSGPPVISAGVTVVAPADSDYVTAFDLREGSILWEKRSVPSLGDRLLGADAGRLYVAGDRVRALDLRTGEEGWQGELLGFGATDGFALRDSVLVSGAGGHLRIFEASTGSLASRIQIIDSRIDASEPLRIFLARDTLLAATPLRVFALRPQTDAWAEIEGGAKEDPFRRVSLLEAEGRYDEAMGVLEELVATLRSRDALERARTLLKALGRKASQESRDPGPLSRILARGKEIAKDREELLALRLLEAKYLELRVKDVAGGDAAERLVRSLLELSRLDGVTAPSPDGYKVDVGAYASDALRGLRAAGVPVEDPDGESRALELLRRRAKASEEDGERSMVDAVRRGGRLSLSQLALRSSHLVAAAEACAELAARGAEDGDLFAAGELLEALRSDFPPSAYPAARVRGLPDGVPPSAYARQSLRPLPGLAASVGSGAGPLEKQFWTEGEDEFLVETTDVSEPLPAVFTLAAGGKLRAYDRAGGVILERELPDYPDTSDVKTKLESSIEEPAAMIRTGDRLVLFTPAGFYAFSEGHAAADAGVWKPRDFRLRWMSRLDHPLVGMDQQNAGMRLWGRGLSLPDGRLFFPGLSFDDAGRPLTCLGDGTLFSLDLVTGKQRWRVGGEGSTPMGPAALRGPWLQIVTAAPTGIRVVRNPDAPRPEGGHGAAEGRSAAASPRFIRGPEEGVWNAGLALGGTVAVFAGSSLLAVDVETGRALWRSDGAHGRLSFISGSDLWLTEGSGALVARSVRSGRERRRIEFPERGFAVDTFTVHDPRGRGPGDPAEVARFVVVGRDSSAIANAASRGTTQTGTDLLLVRLAPSLEKAWEAKLHEGPVTYLGGRHVAEDGSILVLYNGEMEKEKWYTRVLRIDADRGQMRLLASVELPGSGTGQPPRLAVLRGGVALGNAAGFGWLAAPETGGTDASRATVEEEGGDTR